MHELLFVCQQNLVRSPACERYFNQRLASESQSGYHASSAGLSRYCQRPLTESIVQSAHRIIACDTTVSSILHGKFSNYTDKMDTLQIRNDGSNITGELAVYYDSGVWR